MNQTKIEHIKDLETKLLRRLRYVFQERMQLGIVHAGSWVIKMAEQEYEVYTSIVMRNMVLSARGTKAFELRYRGVLVECYRDQAPGTITMEYKIPKLNEMDIQDLALLLGKFVAINMTGHSMDGHAGRLIKLETHAWTVNGLIERPLCTVLFEGGFEFQFLPKHIRKGINV